VIGREAARKRYGAVKKSPLCWPSSGGARCNKQAFPRLQHVTIAELLAGKRPKIPLTMLPYIPAGQYETPVEQLPLGI
jgi:hypothetical protein